MLFVKLESPLVITDMSTETESSFADKMCSSIHDVLRTMQEAGPYL